MKKSLWLLIARLFIAFFLLQTVIRFKFPGHADSVLIFTQMGMEPWGRYLTATVETIAAILLLFPKFSVYGAILTAGTMLGAIGGHFTKIGIVPMRDGQPIDGGASLFVFAIILFILSGLIICEKRSDIPFLKFNKK